MSADDLDANFVFETIEDEVELEDEELESSGVDAGKLNDNLVKESANQTKKPEKKSKIKGISPLDIGIEVVENPELLQDNYLGLLDQLYKDQPKPLVVKSHTKVKVLIVCSSALRCLEIIRELKNMPKLKIAKLFSKHMKINEQIEMLKTASYLVGVGTPNRLVKILETDPDAIPQKRVEFLIIDGSHKDKKSMTIWNLQEHHADLKQLYELVKEYTLGVYNF
jgi:hypothetical protein